MSDLYRPKTPNSSSSSWKDSATGMEFVPVKGGCYDMGCGDKWLENKKRVKNWVPCFYSRWIL